MPIIKCYLFKRSFDILFSIIMLFFFALPMIMIVLTIRFTSRGSAIYRSVRVGQYNQPFSMLKFRTMQIDTPAVATHLLDNPDSYLTPIGKILRYTSLDELPQLWNILVGDMSIVGPRPALFNQDDLINLRTKLGVDKLVPGLTGWAQINGRDELPIPEKVELDVEYLYRQSFWFDLKIIVLTFLRVIARHGVLH